MKLLHTRGKSRGQVLILTCVTMLILALMVMVSFNLSQAINEKIRLQNHADAQAYSSAVMEARALNTLAYVNRAIAAGMVAQTAIHAWMALASQVVVTHRAFRTAFMIIGGIELVICLSCCYPYCVSNCYHCRDAIQAFRIASKHGREANKHGQDIKGLESDFNNRVKGFKTGMNVLYRGEQAMLAGVALQVAREGSMLQQLKTDNAPKADYSNITVVGGRSALDLNCALEGHGVNTSTGCRNGSAKSITERSKYMAESSNAARVRMERNAAGAAFTLAALPDEIPMMNHLRGMQNNEGAHIFNYNLSARIHENNNRSPQQDKQLKNAGGFTSGFFLVAYWRHGVGAGGGSARIISEGNGGGNGSHTPGQAHQGNHKEMLNCAQDECFINFRAKNSEADDWGQPRVFGATKQKLRDVRTGAKPYEINSSGEVSIELVKGQQTRIRLVPQGTATAVSKAMVYYHQLRDPNSNAGGWQHPPNMFDPFWRAKLHSFTRAELISTLTLAGDVTGAQIAATAPVEGR